MKFSVPCFQPGNSTNRTAWRISREFYRRSCVWAKQVQALYRVPRYNKIAGMVLFAPFLAFFSPCFFAVGKAAVAAFEKFLGCHAKHHSTFSSVCSLIGLVRQWTPGHLSFASASISGSLELSAPEAVTVIFTSSVGGSFPMPSAAERLTVFCADTESFESFTPFSAATDANVCAKQAASPKRQYCTGSGFCPPPPRNGGASASIVVVPEACASTAENCGPRSEKFQLPSTFFALIALLLSAFASCANAPALSMSTLFNFTAITSAHFLFSLPSLSLPSAWA